MKFSTLKTVLIGFIFLPALFSCSTVPKDIPEELTAQELIQKGQSEFENGRYAASLAYYNAVTERYAEYPALYLEASYEIGHLYMKQKKYDKAKVVFQEILDIYANSQPGTLPGSYNKLSQVEMQKLQDKN